MDEAERCHRLAILADGRLVALDCKFVLDDSGIKRQPDLQACGTPEPLTALEERGRDLGRSVVAQDLVGARIGDVQVAVGPERDAGSLGQTAATSRDELLDLLHYLTHLK